MSLVEPIFIIGHPRSGTTLLQCMLSAHSRLFSLPETHFFSEVMRKIARPADEVLSTDEIRLVFEYLHETMAIENDVFEEFRQRSGGHGITGQDIFEFVIEKFRPASDTTCSLRVVEKTPMHAMFVSSIGEIYPDAKFIHIVRDPRDVISSTMKLPMCRSRWVPAYTRSWNEVQLNVENAMESMPEAIFTLRYEDLVSDPSDILQRICEFLSIEYEPEMLGKFSGEYEKNTLRGVENWKCDVRSGRIINHAERWRTRISAGEAWLIEVETRYFMKVYGYERLASTGIAKKLSAVWDSIRIAHAEAQRPLRWLKRFMTLCCTAV